MTPPRSSGGAASRKSKKKAKPVEPHPWSEFLYARARVLRWIRDEFGDTPEQTCQRLAMDPVQVQLILATPLESIPGHPKEPR